jgi:peptidoglycan/LPS O-acetylase OafA/YrhL
VSDAARNPSHFEFIDCLRGLACLGVVVFHVRAPLWVGFKTIIQNPANYSVFDKIIAYLSIPMPFLGYLPIMFFLISGFCLHYSYASTNKELKLVPYGIRRFFRIYPPYLAVVVLGVIIERISADAHYTSSHSTIIQTLLMVQNYGPYEGQMASNPSLWYVPVEVELYVVYPIFYWILRRSNIKITGMIITGVSLSIIALHLPPSAWSINHYSFTTYWIIWCAGALLAEKIKHNNTLEWKAWYWLIPILASCLAVGAYTLRFDIIMQQYLWAAAYFVILFWGLTHISQISQGTGAQIKKILSFLGSISYSLYLVHFPFFMLCGVLWVKTFGGKPANLLISLFFVLLSIPAAYIFYAIFEVPSKTLTKKLLMLSE